MKIETVIIGPTNFAAKYKLLVEGQTLPVENDC